MAEADCRLVPWKRRRSCPVLTAALPQEVFSEILTRLPVRTLLRFKSVCRSWKALISHPYFISLHHDRAINRRRPQLLIVPCHARSQKEFGLYTYKGGRREASLLYEKKFSQSERFPSSYECNGLILFIHAGHIVVCNPTTRESLTLPKSSRCSTLPPHLTIDNRRVGFGFVSSTKEYKVAHYFYRSYDFVARTYSIGLEVFTLGTNYWRVTAEDPPYPIMERSPACTGGAIYWHIDNRLRKSSTEAILCFDLSSERFRVIPAPSPCSDLTLFGYTSLTTVEGDLCIFYTSEDERKLDIWMYANQYSWIHGFCIDLLHIDGRLLYIMPVAIHDGKLLLHLDDGLDRLEYYDPRSKSFEIVVRTAEDLAYYKKRKRFHCFSYFDERSRFQVIPYVESLVPVGTR